MQKEGICPVCHSDNIEYGYLDLESDDFIVYPCKCNECHSTWKEVYELKYFGPENIEEERREE